MIHLTGHRQNPRILFLLLLFMAAMPLLGQTFDIQAFSDSTKYGWKNYEDRLRYRSDLMNRQNLLQLYELEAQPTNTNIIKSALVPGWGQFSTKFNTKGTIILGSELMLMGSALYFYDKAMYNYRLYENATQIEDIERFYKDAQGPYQYTYILLGFASVVWIYNIFDVIQSTEDYNENLWQDILQRQKSSPVQITPNGLELRF